MGFAATTFVNASDVLVRRSLTESTPIAMGEIGAMFIVMLDIALLGPRTKDVALEKISH